MTHRRRDAAIPIVDLVAAAVCVGALLTLTSRWRHGHSDCVRNLAQVGAYLQLYASRYASDRGYPLTPRDPAGPTPVSGGTPIPGNAPASGPGGVQR